MRKKNLASVDGAWQIRGRKYCPHDQVIKYIDEWSCCRYHLKKEGGCVAFVNVTEYGGIVKYVYNFFSQHKAF